MENKCEDNQVEVVLPPEMISKILTFLPVKPLLKFRCVSKWYDSLIYSPAFMKQHLQCSSETNSNKKLILSRGAFIYSATIDQKANHIDGDVEVLEIPPFQLCDSHPIILGSCRGLLCLGVNNCCMLWNPSTRTYHDLPNVDDGCKEKGVIYSLVHGFGYDELHDDYKVVRVVQFMGISHELSGLVENYDNEVMIFNLKSNSWKRASDFPHFIHGQRAVFVNGALHYIVSSKKGNVLEEENKGTSCLIASFDISDENYQLVPQHDYPNQHLAIGIGELGGCLCMIRHYNLGRLNQVWVMKEYGVEQSWTELFRITMDDGHMHCLKLLTYLGCVTQVLIKMKGKICCLDLKRRSFEHVQINGTDEDDDDELSLDEFDDVFVYTESLVLLANCDGDNGSNVDDNDEDAHDVYCDSDKM